MDRHVAVRLDAPRNQVQRWLEAGQVQVNGRPVRPSRRVEEGDLVACEPPEPTADDRVLPEDGALAVIYEDPHLVVLDKPSGLAMHPGAGRATGTLAHRLIAHYPEIAMVGGSGRPGIVHRLDVGTSGIVVVARDARAYRRLSTSFAERRVEKRYLAIAHGQPEATEIRVDAPIGRHRTERKQMTVRGDGRPALSNLRVLDRSSRLTLFAIAIETGRTHQIRVHLKHHGFPIVGDPTYGEARWRSCAQRLQGLLRDFPRPALHAWTLELDHPESGERCAWEAPPPADFDELWKKISGRSVREALGGGGAAP